MNVKTILAVALIVVGLAAFGYQVVWYATFDLGRDVGSMQMSARHEHFMPLQLLCGAIALIGGIALLFVDKNDFRPTATP